jgi:hypothetical protein
MDYNAIALRTTQTIRRTGAPIKVSRAGDSSYDPETSTNSAGPVVKNGHAARSEYSSQQIDGTSILSGDVRFLMAVHDANNQPMPQPVAGNELTFAGETFRVVISKPVAPAGIAVTWDTQARK